MMTSKDPGTDYIVRATAYGGFVRAFAARTTTTCTKAAEIHQLSPSAAAALGRLMTGVLMMTQDLKREDHSITAIVKSDGPIGGLTVIGQGDATVRGLVSQPVVESVYSRPGKLDIGAVVGSGTLTVMRDLGLKEPYVGKVDLVSGEIAEDLTYYLAVSEQTPSAVSLGVQMDQRGVIAAGGLIVQLLPGAGDEVAERVEQRVSGFPEVTHLMSEGFNPHQLLDLLFGDPDIKYLDVTPCGYACHCSRERMVRNLVALGQSELEELAADEKGIELTCHFCNQRYHFNSQDMKDLIQAIRS